MSEPYLRKIHPARVTLNTEPIASAAAVFIYPHKADIYTDTGSGIALARTVHVESWVSTWDEGGALGFAAVVKAGDANELRIETMGGCKCGPLRHFTPGDAPAMVGT